MLTTTSSRKHTFSHKNAIVEVLHKSCGIVKQKQRIDGRRTTDSLIKLIYSIHDCKRKLRDFKLRTETDGGHICLSKIDFIDNVDDELDDILPVVDAWGVGFLYAAGTVDYECYVHLTFCNMRYHMTR